MNSGRPNAEGVEKLPSDGVCSSKASHELPVSIKQLDAFYGSVPGAPVHLTVECVQGKC